ncbi:hypothetical protein C1645_803494 [Glomus cerebriforme]|uniref:Crinkler effector protein N-terminal domain-containing protein n=1 Tax=Glomus cerebriforme TaxID=658196 RepID=A0A397THU5_9GLOM|nr:hypothetical protein C1645_803494 [Glomus cerebriforme]
MFTATILCLVHGDPIKRAFSVEVDRDKRVDYLKHMIKMRKQPRFDAFTADELDLWKVNVPFNKFDDKINFSDIKTVLDGEELFGLSKIDDVFEDKLIEDNIHILVQCPNEVQKDSEESKSIIERINSLEFKLAKLEKSGG